MTRDTSSKQKNARESGQEYRGKEHQLEQRPQRQGRRRPAADRQTLASGAYVRREKGDQQHRQARRGDGGDRWDQESHCPKYFQHARGAHHKVRTGKNTRNHRDEISPPLSLVSRCR